MDHFSLIILLFIFTVLNTVETAESNVSVTQTIWFWPLLGICLAFLLSVPCTLMTVVMFCHNKTQTDDCDESNISSNPSSSSSTPVQRRLRHHHCRHQYSHYAGGFHSPPPPYTTCEQPANVFISSSLPPPYESHLTDDVPITVPTISLTIINVQPAESTGNQSSNNPASGTTLDVSSALTNPSIQTFQI